MIPDYALETTFDFKFTTRAFASGVPTTLAGTPVIAIYEDNSTTEITTAETLTVDFDGVTGLNNLRIAATAANGFESGKSYTAVITTGTVGGVSVVGEVVLNFSIEKCSALRPTMAGRTLDVTATGAAGLDWGNVENKTTSNDLSATVIQLCDTTTDVTNRVTANVDQLGGVAQSLTDLKDFADTGYDPVAHKVQGVVLVDSSTDVAALASVCTEARLSELDAGTGGKMANQVDVIQVDTTTDIPLLIATAQADLDILTGADGATLATLQGNYAPAKAGDEMGLVADAITAAKFDESTAFPLAVADAGATEVARTGADSDTLETLSDELDALGTSLGNIAVTGAAINVSASTAVVTVGDETNTYTATAALDGVYHQIDTVGAGTEIDAYYEFEVGGDGVPTSVTWHGRLQETVPVGNTIVVYGYDWDTGWVQIGTIFGIATAVDSSQAFDLFVSMVGTGANLGKVRIRFYDTGLDAAAALYTDQIFVSHAVVRRTVGYANGEIWVNTNTGVAGTELFVNGTADNPVLTWADALTISASLGINNFRFSNNSSITLTAATERYVMEGHGWTLALGGQSLSGTHLRDATVSGVCTGAVKPHFHHCIMGTCTLPPCELVDGEIAGTLTVNAVGDFYISNCSAVNGVVIDFGAAIANTTFYISKWYGDLELQNMGQSGTDVLNLCGGGHLTFNANCVGGTVNLYGMFTYTNNGSGLTINEDSSFNSDNVRDSILDDATRFSGANVDAAISSRSSHSAANVWAVVTRSLTDKAGFSLAATGLNLITQVQAGAIELAKALCDRVITSANHNVQNSLARYVRAIVQFGGYEGGNVWIDTVNGTPGTEDFENGTCQEPVNTYADALTIATSLGLFKFEIANGSTITLSAATTDKVMSGHGWILALNGQDISGTHFKEARVSGIASGTALAHFHHCRLQTCTLPPVDVHDGICEGTITLASAGQYYFYDNISDGTFIIDFAGIAGTKSIDMQHTGDLEVWNMGQVGTDTLDIAGSGMLTVAASCVGGVINVYGDIAVTDNGTTTINFIISEVTLVDGSITGATFDGATAFPLASADSGATAVARTGADSDTLETLSDQIDDVPTNSELAARTLLAASYGTAANQTTILNRLGAWTGTGINTLLGAFKALFSKVALAPSDIGGTFDPAEDSVEALRDHGDVAWITATGFNTVVPDVAGTAATLLSTTNGKVDAVKTDTAAIKLKTDNLPGGFPKNQAFADFEFLMVDTNDDPAPSLTVTATRSIDGGAFAAAANPVVEVSSGVYKIDFAASDLNGDFIFWIFAASGAKNRYLGIKTTT